MKQSLYKSLALHFVVFLLIMVDIPLFWHNKTTLNQVPIIVDLNNVKISEMTNLPPKAKMGKEDKAASKVKRKIENNYTKKRLRKRLRRPSRRKIIWLRRSPRNRKRRRKSRRRRFPRPSRNPSPNLNRKLKRSRNSPKKANLSWRIR